jgi:hypothetical protein
MSNMIQATVEQIRHVLIVQCVKNLPPLTPPTNQAQVAQAPELV